MADIIDFSFHKQCSKIITGHNSLNDLERSVSNIFDLFSNKWLISAKKSAWVPYWVSIIDGAGVDFQSLNVAAQLCLEYESELPTVFYFTHICGLYSDFKNIDI
ncbi:MAG: hypothetical protein QM500_03585 [Methylococcales bacterium]